MENNINSLSPMNAKYVQGAANNKNVQTPPQPQEKEKGDNKKLLLALAGLAIAGGAIALGVIHHKKVSAKAAENAAQQIDKAKGKVAPAASNAEGAAAKTGASAAPSDKAGINSAGGASDKADVSAPDTSKGQPQSGAAQKTDGAAAQLTGDELFKENRIKIIEQFYPGKTDFYGDRPHMLYHDIQSDFYSSIRGCKIPYAKSANSADDIARITARETSEISVLSQNGWHYRQPKTHISAPTIGRVSLNVYPEPDLIAKLDDLVARSGGAINYKTPDVASAWHKRHDPITIYFKRKLDKQTADEIIKIATPHIRKADDSVMLGRKLADGIFSLHEPNERDVQKLVKRANDLGFDDKFIGFLESTDWLGASLYDVHSNGQKYVHTSPGLVAALNKMLDEFEKILA